ncbi:common central domain of tyrosinase-domain-containing protein [Gigaspora rosea]|uniref:tyrosinase n=1 Tax=Gigaspora rosea TaxID=44941 RepID=A0A397UVF9_9GLOM|nr:common central domain of tyrosinase-domain-containing protein [Gigaspora rosea]
MDIDPTSYWAVASIHGLPYEPYDFLETDTIKDTDWHPPTDADLASNKPLQPGGYCHHGDILFPTWHRPYVLLLEKLIHDEAKKIAMKYPEKSDDPDKKGKLRSDYLKALEELRFPYWDWASPATLEKGVPSVLTDDLIPDVETPDGKKISIPNPLRSYTLPRDLGTLSLAGNSANPTKRPYKPDKHTPFTPKGYATIRHPDQNYVSNIDATSLSVVTACNTTYRPSLYQLFNYVTTWRHFSNHGDKALQSAVLTETTGHYTSIEFIHDAVHSALGGQGGHMANPDIASFDPIFFLHHCNVDRLIAIWQAINPNAWLNEDDLNVSNDDPLKDKKLFTEGTYTQTPRESINENTPLTPFRKSESEFWTSKGVRDVVALGYTYPELRDNIDKTKDQKSFDRYKSEELKTKMVDLYRPNKHLENHWKLTATVNKNKADGPYELRVFLDLDKADHSTSTRCPNYAGSISVFARTKDTQCANCKAHPDAVVHGCVDLTNCMQALDINLNSNPMDINALQPQQIKFVAVNKNDNSPLDLKDLLVKADLYKYEEIGDRSNWRCDLVSSVYPPKPA